MQEHQLQTPVSRFPTRAGWGADLETQSLDSRWACDKGCSSPVMGCWTSVWLAVHWIRELITTLIVALYKGFAIRLESDNYGYAGWVNNSQKKVPRYTP
jgi:hypothetical protein